MDGAILSHFVEQLRDAWQDITEEQLAYTLGYPVRVSINGKRAIEMTVQSCIEMANDFEQYYRVLSAVTEYIQLQNGGQ